MRATTTAVAITDPPTTHLHDMRMTCPPPVGYLVLLIIPQVVVIVWDGQPPGQRGLSMLPLDMGPATLAAAAPTITFESASRVQDTLLSLRLR